MPPGRLNLEPMSNADAQVSDVESEVAHAFAADAVANMATNTLLPHTSAIDSRQVQVSWLSSRAVITTALVAAGLVVMVIAPNSPVVSTVGPFQGESVVSLIRRSAAAPLYHYGLYPCKCPKGKTEESAKGMVTLPSIKANLGVDQAQAVEFKWVYPAPLQENSERVSGLDSVQQNCLTYGGFKYSWEGQERCFAFGLTGSNLTLTPSSYVPSCNWHPVTMKGLRQAYTSFCWFPPSRQHGKCEAGCFVYKEVDGEAELALEVVSR